MLYAELRNYLTVSTDQATVDNYDDAIDVFNDFDIPEYMDIFDRIYGEAAHLSDVEVIDGFNNTLDTMLTTIITQHGIVLNESPIISDKIKLCVGLFRLTNYEEQQTLLLILESNQTSQETFGELMELVSDYKTEHVLSMVESVSDFFIENFKNLVLTPAQEKLIPAELSVLQVADFTNFKEKVTNRPLWSDKYFSHVEAIGLPFSIYLQVYLIEQRDYFTETNLTGVAEELIAMACLSEETSSKAHELVREWSDRIFSDLNLITKLDIQVNKLLMEFHRA